MKFALNIPLAKLLPVTNGGKAACVRRMIAGLEAAGVDACLTSEHPAPSTEWLRTDPAAHDAVDPLTALSFIAGMSEKLQVFTNVVVLPFRNPFLTAKAAATLQVISDNRLILGVGTGYMIEEFDALGVPYRERGALTDEALEVMRAVWTGENVEFRGRHFHAVGNLARPAPTPPPPVWVGGGSDKALERAARWGDGWVPYFLMPTNDPTIRKSAVVSMDHFGEKVARLHELRDGMGRTAPFDLSVCPPFRPQTPTAENARRFLDEVAELEAHGVNWIWASLPAPSLEAYLDMVAWFGSEIIAVHGRR